MSTMVKTVDASAQQALAETITLTPSAIARVHVMLKERGAGIGLRLGVKKSGCSGYKYVLDFVDVALPNDHIFRFDGNCVVYVRGEDFTLLKGTRMDYVKRGLNAVFEYYNPNQESSCGCGESFSVK